MGETIRRIKLEDFQEVSDLFLENGILEEGNTVEELMWLFSDPMNPNRYNAFVAVDNGNSIIGVIGYILSKYKEGEQEFNGVIPFSWKLKSNYKGMAGVSLFRKVSEIGDIEIAIGGTDIARKLYPLFKFNFLINSSKYYKILNVNNYYDTLDGRNYLKRIGTIGYLIPSYFKNLYLNVPYNDVSLVPYTNDNFVEDQEFESVLRKKITKENIDWQLSCPRLKTYAFVIKKGDDTLGMCVLNVKKINKTFKGRIVHLPFLGEDIDLWKSVLNICLKFLKNQGCCFVSALAINNTCKSGLIEAGFGSIQSHIEPVYVKNGNVNIDQFNAEQWHFQYSEGDIGFMDL